MRIFFLALSLVSLVSGTGDASAHRLHNHHHWKLHHVLHLRNHSRYPVLSYSVPQWGPYSGYQYYDNDYPVYLSSVRPYIGASPVYQPGSNNYADYAFGCCGAEQNTVVRGGAGTASGAGISGPLGSTWPEN